MPTFICSNEHIDTIAGWAADAFGVPACTRHKGKYVRGVLHASV